ncbi:hypothetical protein LCGC14_2018770 [marine sediment metagenome]|uniref:Uncharacterized protein n=1 Tax=marine sediment metagenome TaxID=412755 RepID=A0A0F9EYD9_9ZZZZ
MKYTHRVEWTDKGKEYAFLYKPAKETTGYKTIPIDIGDILKRAYWLPKVRTIKEGT